jgi:hypothetical protein
MTRLWRVSSRFASCLLYGICLDNSHFVVSKFMSMKSTTSRAQLHSMFK